MAKIFRRGAVRLFGLLAVFTTILLCFYYVFLVEDDSISYSSVAYERSTESYSSVAYERSTESQEKCTVLKQRSTKITTIDEYSKFNFEPQWMKNKEFWDYSFETRYEQMKNNNTRLPLKVIIVPHSHNDPGWLETVDTYFEIASRKILNSIVNKMQEYTEMTFIWSEISLLQLWWDQADTTKQQALKQLVQSGRFEITTGGWVMTDEANVHIYAMVDQLIEGHQWIKTNLNYTPVTGWSIDPFGHGSTLPYLLSAAGIDGTIIQRIHYAWKEWLATHQYGDFMWQPYWSNSDEDDIKSLLTHNMPFDLYSIKHSCGPHQDVCLNFDFDSQTTQPITDENVKAKADLIIGEYARIASLYPHNVALVPVGDDFRYNQEEEARKQYTNYKKLIDYINAHKDVYNAEISFGLPKHYFRAIRERYQEFPSLKGDFFVYSDIYNWGFPAYWSGYFSTRPMYKMLSRDLENQLRSLEIIFTIATNKARQNGNKVFQMFEKNYEKIILARRNLGLFQHHDAITGTSKAMVMQDYGIRLFDSIKDVVNLQERCIEFLIQKPPTTTQHRFVVSETERDGFNTLPRKLPITFSDTTSQFVVYNSGSQDRMEVITVRTTSAKVEIRNDQGVKMEIQINPVFEENVDVANEINVSDKQFEVLFLANLPAMSLTTFTIGHTEDYKNQMATIHCHGCKDGSVNEFDIRNKEPGDIQLENNKMRLSFDEHSGFLKSVTKENIEKPIQCAIAFSAYISYPHRSGAYLFRPNGPQAERDVFEQYKKIKILITSGPIASDVTVIHAPFLTHTVRIYKTKTDIDNAIYIENVVDFEPPPKNGDTEMFMRFTTDVENGENAILYTDLNGFQYQKRAKVPSTGIEGNYYPITTAAFIQDEKIRLTLLTNHAQGVASYEQGQLEVMIDRRINTEDYRGLGESLMDSRQTKQKFWLIIEQFQTNDNEPSEQNEYQVPSLFSNQLSNSHNYPANIYFIDNQDRVQLNLNNYVSLIEHKFPCDLHVLTLRTLAVEDLPLSPSRSALMVLHRQAYSCNFLNNSKQCTESGFSKNIFNNLKIEGIVSTTLTGLKTNDIIQDFSSIYVKPMDIRTFNITFAN